MTEAQEKLCQQNCCSFFKVNHEAQIPRRKLVLTLGRLLPSLDRLYMELYCLAPGHPELAGISHRIVHDFEIERKKRLKAMRQLRKKPFWKLWTK